MRRKRALALLLAALGCTDRVVGPSGTVATVVVEPGDIPMLVGDTFRLVASTYDAEGDELTDHEIAWASSDPSVASVSESGLVTGLVAGSAVIYAASGSKADSVVVTIALPFIASQIGPSQGYHTCAINQQGAAYCWGRNPDGQLGVNVIGGNFARPTLVAGGHAWSQITAGLHHTCGVDRTAVAYCWGWNFQGQVGDSTNISRIVPTPVLSAPTMTALALGYNYSCGLEMAGVRCWGSDWISGFAGAPALQTLSGGNSHLCGIGQAGQAWCWGGNFEGEVGDSTTTSRVSPVPVAGTISFTALSSAAYTNCGITALGEAWCWGRNTSGQLGDGSMTNRSYPVMVAGGLQFKAITTGGYHSCGVTTSGQAYCWGNNGAGQLGDGSQTSSPVPVEVSGGHAFHAISAGSSHTCAITVSDRVYCWGYNGYGTLGDGSTIDRIRPVPVSPP